MKTPDKIYLHGYEFSVRPVNSWSEKLTDGIKGHKAINVEYVRKDALLEWAKNMRRICKDAKPIEKAYQTMIDKIESL